MGLKVILYHLVSASCGRIKSDQNGIESNIFNTFPQRNLHEIKSDQNGIESQEIVTLYGRSAGSIKSDQNGIERREFVWLCSPTGSIKSDQNGIERSFDDSSDGFVSLR